MKQNSFGDGTEVFIIAEVGINHNGCLKTAKDLIRAAKEAGADAVKVQVRDLKEIYSQSILDDPLKAEHGTQHMLSELKKTMLSYSDIRELQRVAQDIGIIFFGTPFDLRSLKFLVDELKTDLIKVGSPDFSNLPLLFNIVKCKKPMILSTGMSTESEIIQVVNFLKSHEAEFKLLHCNSTYPAAAEDLNLNFLPKLKEISGVTVGYSGHEAGYGITLGAVALGAKIIERHITFDTTQEGLDHSSSLDIGQFKEMVREIRTLELALGKAIRVKSQGEAQNFLSLGKAVVAKKKLRQGEVFSMDDCVAKSPAKGISPLEVQKFLGEKMNRDVLEGDYLYPDFFGDLKGKKNTFEIKKTWGVVGRLNDFKHFLDIKPDLVEIHMTWRDVVSFSPIKGEFKQDLVVHAPEYFKDKLIDFTTEDPQIKEISIEMLRETIRVAKELDKNFSGQKNDMGPRVVVHPGGHFSKPTASSRSSQYRTLLKNLKNIDSRGVRLHVENMPPFPWYFGGQWYNTIFMDPKEIAQFSEESGWNICYDLSHALLYCNHVGIDIKSFSKDIMNHIGYLHISDAAGVTNEGLQLGQGNLDLEHVAELVKKLNVGFIPEIWQGHLNRGEGFKEALGLMESLLKNKLSTPPCGCANKSICPH